MDFNLLIKYFQKIQSSPITGRGLEDFSSISGFSDLVISNKKNVFKVGHGNNNVSESIILFF